MEELIQDNYIFLDENYKTKKEILNFIANKAYEYGISSNSEGLYEDLLKRESEFSTGLQDEFAIPHARSKYIKKIAVFFIRNKPKIDWETLDGSEVHNLFVLLVPKINEGNVHLQMISTLATCLLEDEFKDKVKLEMDRSKLKEYILANISNK